MLSFFEISRRARALSCVAIIAFALIITFKLSVFFPYIFSVPITITATGEPGVENPGGSSEVWIFGITVNGQPFDLRGVEVEPGWEFRGGEHLFREEIRDGRLVSAPWLGQPGSLQLHMPPGAVDIEFHRHAWSGIVKIESRSGIQEFDLYVDVIGAVSQRYQALNYNFTIIIVALAMALVISTTSVILMLKPILKFAEMLSRIVFLKRLYELIVKEDSFDTQIRRQFVHLASMVFAIFLVVLVSAPAHISRAANHVLDMDIIFMVLFVCVIISLLVACSVFLLRQKYKYVEVLITGLFLLCYINATIIPFQAQILDGQPIVNYSTDSVIQNVLVFVLITFFTLVWRKYIRNIAFVLIPIIGLFAANDLYRLNAFASSNETAWYEREAIIASGTTFSTERNIVVIVPDSLQGTVVERTFIEYPELLDRFDGFSVFTRTVSTFPFTNFSMPTMHSGTMYPSDEYDITSNLFASVQDSFMTDMQRNGVRVNAFGDTFSVLPLFDEIPTVEAAGPTNAWSRYSVAVAASIARLTGYWITGSFIVGTDLMSELRQHMLDSVLWYEIITDRLTVGDGEYKLLYFWEQMFRHPIIFARDGTFSSTVPIWDPEIGHAVDEQDLIDETYFGLMQMVQLFEAMKGHDVYDNSLIIIVSDHGHFSARNAEHLSGFEDFYDGYRKNGNWREASMHNAVLFIKPPNARGQAKITHAPSWNGDVRAIINYYFENFDDFSPIEVVGEIRAENPDIPVMFFSPDRSTNPYSTSEEHEVLHVTALQEIPSAFAAHSGILD